MRFSLFATLALLLALAGCDNNTDAQKNQQTPSSGTEPPSTHPTSPQADLDATTQTLQQRLPGCDGEDCPAVSVTWPAFAQRDALNQAVEKQLIRQLAGNGEDDGSQATSLAGVADAFLADAGNLPNGAAHGWQLIGEAKLLARRGDLATVRIETYEFTGGAHGMPATHWLNWDLAANRLVTLGDILQPGQEHAFWAVAQAAHQQWLKDEANADDDFRGAWPFQKTGDFRLTDNGVRLLYGVYTLGPYVMGMPELTLPRGDLQGVVKAKFLSGE